MQARRSQHGHEAGFTIAELTVASVIAAIVIVAAGQFVIVQVRSEVSHGVDPETAVEVLVEENFG